MAPPVANRLVVLARAVAGLTPLATGERLKAAPACLPTRPCSLYFLLSCVLEPPRKAVPLRHYCQAAPSLSSFATVKMPLPASPQLHLLPPELVHLATEPESRGSRRSSSSPPRIAIDAGVGAVLAVADHLRSSTTPFSPFPQFPYELLMLTPVLDQTAMARVGRRTLRSAAASTIVDGDLLLCS